MLYLGKNIEYLLKLHKIDIKILAIQTGIPPATISQMQLEKSDLTAEIFEPILDFFRIDMDTLLYKDMSHPDYLCKKSIMGLICIPVVELKHAKNVKSAKILKFISSVGITNKNVFGIPITANILAPAFQNNSIAIIDPDLTPKEGDYVLCCLDEDPNPVFRQIFMDENLYFFKNVNFGGEIKFYETFTILGVVIKSISSFQ